MARQLNREHPLFNQTIYSVYVRNHSVNGTFTEVVADLPRIQALGVDIIWLLPIHPIGVINKKGELGCPYSIRDYRAVNPEYGDLPAFQRLLEEAHRLGLKVMLDVVYNHTAHDSWLAASHAEWFYRKPDGRFGNKVGDWTDIIDLDYTQSALWEEQLETLEYWAGLGVDGFRCDVAPLIPLAFWQEARRRLGRINPQLVLLAESVHADFIRYLRRHGVTAHSDGELYEAFDVTYDYDVHDGFSGYFNGERSLREYVQQKRRQDAIYPLGYVKLRFLENHDQPRAHHLIPDMERLRNWTAFQFFEKGVALLHAGQEVLNTHTPSLFERDPIDWSMAEQLFTSLIQSLIAIKKKDLFRHGIYELADGGEDGVLEASYELDGVLVLGVFNVEGRRGTYRLKSERFHEQTLAGVYDNWLDGQAVQVADGAISLGAEPLIFQISYHSEGV
jgi:glycosidase